MPTTFGQFQRIELGFGLSNFSKPIEYSGKEAWVHQIVQLALMDPGTIVSNPTIGVGARRYDFLIEDDRRRLEQEINRQVPIFYPDMPFQSCKVLPPEDDATDLDIIYLVITLTSQTDNIVVVALKKGYNYIDYAIAM